MWSFAKKALLCTPCAVHRCVTPSRAHQEEAWCARGCTNVGVHKVVPPVLTRVRTRACKLGAREGVSPGAHKGVSSIEVTYSVHDSFKLICLKSKGAHRSHRCTLQSNGAPKDAHKGGQTWCVQDWQSWCAQGWQSWCAQGCAHGPSYQRIFASHHIHRYIHIHTHVNTMGTSCH